jgi:hypothetical protein
MCHGFGMARDVCNEHSETLWMVVRTLKAMIIVSQQKQERVEIRVSLGLSRSADGDITSIGALRPCSEDLEIAVLFEKCRPEELCDPIRRQVEVIIYRKTKTGGI